jgi:hypothetical protein
VSEGYESQPPYVIRLTHAAEAALPTIATISRRHGWINREPRRMKQEGEMFMQRQNAGLRYTQGLSRRELLKAGPAAGAELSTAIERYRAMEMTFWLSRAEAMLAGAVESR